MKSFLEYVAEDILAKHGSDLSRVAIVFPNKRASLFMNTHLAKLAGKPIWSPAYITISDLFRHHSSRMVADPIKHRRRQLFDSSSERDSGQVLQ